MKNVFFTSDLHLGHKGVIEFCKRPFASVEAMDEALIKRYNARVRNDHVVYFLGDVSFHPPRIGIPQLQRLNGIKILVQGNHDKWSPTQYRNVFVEVVQEAVIDLAGHRIRLSHYPPGPSDNGDPNAEKYLKRNLHLRPVRAHSSEMVFCGHVHEMWKTREDYIVNVGVDVWNYAPVGPSDIMKLLWNLRPGSSTGRASDL